MIRQGIQFLKLIRFPNLAITALALWMHWYFLLKLPLKDMGWNVDFNSISLVYLCLAFAMVMGSGFIINDIYDMDIDAINKGDNRIVGKHFSVKEAWIAFWILLVVAASISLGLAYRFDKLRFIWIYPAAALLLIIYSIWLKKTTLLGNILIASLCGAVLLIPLIAESSSVSRLPRLIQQIIYKNFSICCMVAGFLTLAREIVKDIEDIPGDQAAGARTLPIRKGLKFAKNIISLLLIVIVGVLITQLGWGHSWFFSILSMVVGFVIPLIYVFYLVNRAQQFTEFHRISNLLKFTMVTGMVLLPMLLYYQYSWTG